MNEKTLEQLTRLAEKFGTTIEHLWSVLLKQAGINAMTGIVMALAMVMAWVWLFRFVRRNTTTPKETAERPYPHAEWDEELALSAWLGVTIFGIFVSWQTYSAISTAITVLFNPEYWVLKQLLH